LIWVVVLIRLITSISFCSNTFLFFSVSSSNFSSFNSSLSNSKRSLFFEIILEVSFLYLTKFLWDFWMYWFLFLCVLTSSFLIITLISSAWFFLSLYSVILLLILHFLFSDFNLVIKSFSSFNILYASFFFPFQFDCFCKDFALNLWIPLLISSWSFALKILIFLFLNRLIVLIRFLW